MSTWIARARRMTMTDCLTAVEVVGLALWIEVALRVTPFSVLLQRISRLSRSAPSAAPVPGAVPRLVRFVTVAYEILPFSSTCLRQSLVLHALLERRAVRSRVCLGVARNGAALDAHAWIESDFVVTDADVARFSELRTVSQLVRTSEQSRF
jgi:Transglutaminase-like superfamily